MPSVDALGIQQAQGHRSERARFKTKCALNIRLRTLSREHGEQTHDCARKGVDLTRALIGSEEKPLLQTGNRAAEIAAKLVLAQFRPGCSCLIEEERICVKNVIAKVFIEFAVIGRASGLRDYVDVAAGRLALRSVVEAGLNSELFNGIRRRRRDIAEVVVRKVICVDSVDNEVVGRASLPINENVPATAARSRRIG